MIVKALPRIAMTHREDLKLRWYLFAVIVQLIAAGGSPPAAAQDASAVWREFTSALVRGEITAQRLRPYQPELVSPLLGYLQTLRREVTPGQWKKVPEFHRVGGMIHYVVPLGFGKDTSVFCFSLTLEHGNWYFTHLESIVIRLDTLGTLPVSTFPDLPDSVKSWMREELYWSQIVVLYNSISKEKGKEYFLNLLRDGQGYALAAKAWIPFVPPRRAFVLYLCWEQSNLRGNRVVLERLSDTLVQISMTPKFLELYRRTAHLSTQISFADYREIFEVIWKDRAANGGWNVDIAYPGETDCRLILR